MKVQPRHRSTRRSHSMIPRFGEGIRGRVRLPEPRKDGSRHYLKQWLLTAVPLALTISIPPPDPTWMVS